MRGAAFEPFVLMQNSWSGIALAAHRSAATMAMSVLVALGGDVTGGAAGPIRHAHAAVHETGRR
jgi:hypothetical protein